MRRYSRFVVLFVLLIAALTWTACSSDGYTGTTSVYVGYGYGGYGPGWGYGWRGGYYPPPVVIGPPPPVVAPF